MSVSDLLQLSAPPSYSNISSSRTDMPDWWDTAAQDVIGKAASLANTPTPLYQGPRVADFTAPQQQAFTQATNMANTPNPFIGQAASQYGNAGQLFNQSDFNQFQNPYQQGVLDVIAKQGARNLSENLLPQVNDTFIKAGQFGSSGNLDLTGRALRDTNEAILNQQAQALNSNFNNSMNSYQNAQNRQANVGTDYANLANTSQNQQEQNLQNLLYTGGLQQANQQKNLDTSYQDFLTQQNQPYQNINNLAGVLNNFKPSGVNTTVSTNPITASSVPPGPSPLQNILGTLGQAFG